jgi:hypothetical protein
VEQRDRYRQALQRIRISRNPNIADAVLD